MFSKHRNAQKSLQKVAFWSELGPTNQAAILGAVTAPIAAAATQAGVDGLRGMLQSRNKAKAYQNMVSNNPHLKSYDSNTSQMYFNSLHRVNPHLAQDPLAAGSFVHERHMMSTPGREHGGMIAGLGDASKIRGPQARPSPFTDAAAQIAKGVPAAIGAVHADKTMAGMKAQYEGDLAAQKNLVRGLRMRDEPGGSAMSDYNKAQAVSGSGDGRRLTGSYFQNDRSMGPRTNKVASFNKLASTLLG